MNPKLSTYIDQQQRLCDEATEGPWYHRQSGEVSKSGELDWIANAPKGEAHNKIILGRQSLYGGSPDYAFIASSRTELPRCLEIIQGMKATLEHAARSFERVHGGATNSIFHEALQQATKLIP